MQQPKEFYTSQIIKYTEIYKQYKQKLFISSITRLVVFVLVALGIYFGYPNTQIIITNIAIGIIAFLYLITRHSTLEYARDKSLQLMRINKLEIEVLEGNRSALDAGKEFVDPLHPYGQDIDLFGDRSFFQFINRTATLTGKQKLADLLGENNIDHIEAKQEVVQELAQKIEWRQEFSAKAALVDTEISIQTIKNWLHTYNSFTTEKTKYVTYGVTAISIISIILAFIEMMPMSALLLVLFLGLSIIGLHLKKINQLYNEIGKSKATFDQYHKLIEQIEETEFVSEALIKQREEFNNGVVKASSVVKELAQILNAFDQRNNMIFGFLGNGFLVWDLYQCYRIEKWISKNHQKVQTWFDVIDYFDAYNSLANFAFNHPTYVYPTIDTTSTTLIKSAQLGHPMLDPTKRVDNDITIDKEQFFIITGANMAGKSTFLRTIALQIVMANIGLPVCAKTCTYRPIKLYTSMRTTDSLSDDASYFFSELTQLKQIVDALKTEEYFVILDEILKGTNSKDKAEGSRKFVEKLVRASATGIIATHDLSLCEIANEIPAVKNKYFDAQIINDELYFDYTFKEGVCQNMNASFLLSKMEII